MAGPVCSSLSSLLVLPLFLRVSKESVLEGRGWQPYCSGPLTENGRFWNAKHLVQNMVMQRFDNVKLAADGNSFRGTWSGMEPHQFAWIGTRVAATEHPTPPPVPPVKPPQPPAVHAPSAVTVELSNSQRQANVTVAPGGVITLKVATYAGTGYRLNVVSPPQKSAALISGRTDEPMSRPGGTGKGKMLVGAGTWKVYKYQASRGATNTFDVVCQFSRSGQRAELEYRLTVHVKEAFADGPCVPYFSTADENRFKRLSNGAAVVSAASRARWQTPP